MRKGRSYENGYEEERRDERRSDDKVKYIRK